MTETPVRVRFAPSPTGHLHVGGARTAIFNWLYARRHGGTFIIRVEDTDQARSTIESEKMVLDDLRWLGLDWDEGPDVGGPHHPYRQSERLAHYARAAEEMIASGHAYRCFCEEEDLDRRRKEAEAAGRPPHYDLRCFRLTPDEAQANLEASKPFVVRFHVPKEDEAAFDADVTIQDLIRGEVTWKKESLGDFILLRSDRMPTYNFSVVVDDHDMAITHVIRAEEHLTNTHRQVLIYRALGWPIPQFAHVSLILGEDRAKLSKRHGATSVAAYADEGFLPEAMLNYLALLGWSTPDGLEVFSRQYAIDHFSFDRVNPAAAVFDPKKFEWVNGQHLHVAPPDALRALIAGRLESLGWLETDTPQAREWIDSAIELVQKSVTRLYGLLDAMEFFFVYEVHTILEHEENRQVLSEPEVVALLRLLGEDLRMNGVPLDSDAYHAFADRMKTGSGLKGKKLFMPMRVALTGWTHGPELHRTVPLLERGSRIEALGHMKGPLERVESLFEQLSS